MNIVSIHPGPTVSTIGFYEIIISTNACIPLYVYAWGQFHLLFLLLGAYKQEFGVSEPLDPSL